MEPRNENTFVVLVQACLDAGVCPSMMEQFEAAGATSLEELRSVWKAGGGGEISC